MTGVRGVTETRSASLDLRGSRKIDMDGKGINAKQD